MSRPVHSLHRGLDYRRVEWDRDNGHEKSLEVVFADVWEEENQHRPGINYGHGILQDLMMERTGEWHQAHARLVLTRRDCSIAATAIQWLGTNCGRSFLNTVFERAGYRLLDRHERNYEKKLTAYDASLRKREIEVENRERALEALLDRFDTEKTVWERTQRGWFAMMILATTNVFRRTEPEPGRRKRHIALADE